jgi:hypothetical protein
MARAIFKGSPVQNLLNKLWENAIIKEDTTAKDAFELDENGTFAAFTWQKFKTSYGPWRTEKIKEQDCARNPVGPPLGKFIYRACELNHSTLFFLLIAFNSQSSR